MTYVLFVGTTFLVLARKSKGNTCTQKPSVRGKLETTTCVCRCRAHHPSALSIPQLRTFSNCRQNRHSSQDTVFPNYSRSLWPSPYKSTVSRNKPDSTSVFPFKNRTLSMGVARSHDSEEQQGKRHFMYFCGTGPA